MTLALYAICDGCGAAQRGDDYPEFWPAYTPDENTDSERFCTDECARLHLVGLPLHAVRLKHLGLSPSDVRLLELIGACKSNNEIGAVLGISESRVKNRNTWLYAKLGVEGRLEAVMLGGALAVINLNVLAQQVLARYRKPRGNP